MKKEIKKEMKKELICRVKSTGISNVSLFNKKTCFMVLSALILSSCQVYTPKYTGSNIEIVKSGTTDNAEKVSSNGITNIESSSSQTSSISKTSETLAEINSSVVSNVSNAFETSLKETIARGTDASLMASADGLSKEAVSVPVSNTESTAKPREMNPPAIDTMDDKSFKKSMEKRTKEGKEALKRKREATIREWKDKIIPGTTIGGISVEGLTKEEAMEKINSELLAPLMEKKIHYTVDKVVQDLSYTDLEVTVKESVFDEAVSFGKDIDPLELIKLIEEKKGPELTPELTFNEEYLMDLAGKYSERVKNDSNAKNAEYDGETVTLKENAKEKKMDIDDFIKKIKGHINMDPEDTNSFEAKITEIPTSIKPSDLKSITTELTRFTTDYSWSPEGRKANVELASKNLDNILIMPGTEFSFNRMVGPQTKENGFKDSLVYLGNKMVEEPGGGVCQVSTTLYNSLLLAGIDPTMRYNHGMVISYAPMGMDATVAEPVLDFKFKNVFDKPILIKTESDGAELTFKILGDKDAMKGYSYTYDTEVVNHIPWKSETIEDPEYPRGYEKTETTPFDGYEVKVYKTTYKDGREVKKELYHEDKYGVVNEITRIGTGDPSVKTWPEENTSTTESTGTGEDN